MGLPLLGTPTQVSQESAGWLGLGSHLGALPGVGSQVPGGFCGDCTPPSANRAAGFLWVEGQERTGEGWEKLEIKVTGFFLPKLSSDSLSYWWFSVRFV